MAFSVGEDCIDQLVDSIEKASGIKLIRDFNQTIPNYMCPFEYVYEVFKYTNGRGEEAEVGFGNRFNVFSHDIYCELHLLDLSGPTDPRIIAYVCDFKENIDYVKVFAKGISCDVKRSLKYDYEALELAKRTKSDFEIIFKNKSKKPTMKPRLYFIQRRFLPIETGAETKRFIITNLQDGLIDQGKQFLSYVMTSSIN